MASAIGCGPDLTVLESATFEDCRTARTWQATRSRWHVRAVVHSRPGRPRGEMTMAHGTVQGGDHRRDHQERARRGAGANPRGGRRALAPVRPDALRVRRLDRQGPRPGCRLPHERPGRLGGRQAVQRAGVPYTARGAGTGLSGGAIPSRGGVLISFARMNRILEIDLENLRAVVEPGAGQPAPLPGRRPRAAALRPRSVQPEGVHHRRQRRRELGRAAHPPLRRHHQPHARAWSTSCPDGEIVEVGGKRARRARLRPDRPVRRLRGDARDRHQGHLPAGPDGRVRQDAAGRLPDHRGRQHGRRRHHRAGGSSRPRWR